MIDLKELLDDRSTPPPDLAQHLRLGALRGRITLRRRRRAGVVGTFAAVAALLVAGYAAIPARQAGPADTATSDRALAEFGRHLDGTRIVAAAVSEPGNPTVRLRWTPTTLDIRLFVRCRTGSVSGVSALVEVDGDGIMSGGCGHSFGARLANERMWAETGLQVGRPAVFSLHGHGESLGQDPDGADRFAPAPWDAVYGLAIGVRLATEAYPMPSPPSRLWPLDLDPGEYGRQTANPDPAVRWLHSDPADPLRPVSTTIVWRGRYDLVMQSVTPGTLRVSVNGVEVDGADWWDYGAAVKTWQWEPGEPRNWARIPGFSRPQQGETVTVTVTPEVVTGPWQAVIRPAA
ncbi:hypothetical protein [Catellatospora sp. NPDC049609]|uniref:hypothetical protein n=1 Tax=Catellatospora sp. NPDC049609 TaxID=3155505 RepID=UPI003419CC6C